MNVEFQSDQPLTDAACQKATGKTIAQWLAAIANHCGEQRKRRDTIQWIYEQNNKDLWWSTTLWVEFERAQGMLQKDGLIEGYNICVTKTIQAPLPEVYRAFSEANVLSHWFGKKVQAKVEVGGDWIDDSQNHGEYLRVRPDKDLRFTWRGLKSPSTTQVDVAFASKGDNKTGITLTHNRIQNRDEADGLRSAWGLAFDRLKTFVETN